MVGVIFVYVDTVYGFYGYSFSCLVGCFSMIIWTPTVLSVLYACALYFCICTCSAQLSMLHMERRSRNTLIIIIITHGITLSTSAFLACHECFLCGFESCLGLESLGCSMLHFLKLVARGFLKVLRFPPLLH